MRKFLLLISATCIFTGNILIAQTSKESPVERIQSFTDDTSKVLGLIDYAIQLEDENLDSSALYYKMAGDLSNKLNYYNGKIKYGMNYSVVLNMQSKLIESRILNERTLQLAKEKNDSLNMAKAYNNLGNSLNMMANYDSAFSYYLKSVEIFEKIDNQQYLNTIYMNMATVLDNLGQFDKSITYSRKSVRLSEILKDSLRIANAMNNMASSFASKLEFDSAIRIMRKVLPINQTNGDNYSLTAGYITLGNLYNKTKKYQQAIESFKKSLKISETMNYKSGMSIAFNSLSVSYYYLDNFPVADDYADKALQLIGKDQTIDLLQLYKLSAAIKAKLGDYPTAYDRMIKYTTLKDSLTGMQTQKYVAELEQKYMAAEKDNQLFQKQLQIEESKDAIKQKNTWIVIFATGAFLLAVFSVIYYRFNIQKQKLHQKELMNINQQRELEKLKAGMEGQMKERKRIASEIHDDLGSGLTSILFMADSISNIPDKARGKISNITEAARNVMNNMNEIIWSMNTEYDSLEDLVAYIRHHSAELLTQVNIPYKFIIQGEISNVNISGVHRRNIHLVVKESIHNIIKHAHASMVTIQFAFDKNIHIEIADNGKGMDKDALNKFGNGLKNMRKRMESIGGTWDISNHQGTKVKISVPFV